MKKIIKASKTRSNDKKFPRGVNRNNTLYILTLKMTTAQVVETSVTVNNSPIQDYVHPDDHLHLLLKRLLGSNLSQLLQ